MKKFLVAGIAAAAFFSASAFAADMPVKAPVYKAAEPLYDWSGFYVGAYAGVGAQQSHGFDPTGGTPGEVELTGSGFTGGGTVGYNWQFNRNWVVGVEGDFGYLSLSHNTQDLFGTITHNSKTSWIGTLRGRAGYSNGPTLNYITGGGAWVHSEDSFLVNPAVPPTSLSSKTLGGYTIGTGVETMLGGNWTAKAESFYVDVGRGTTLANNGFFLQTDKNHYQGMKFGINYLFGGKQPALMAHNWTGFYGGVVGGTAAMESRGSDLTVAGAPGNQIGDNGDGLTIGGMAGYNWQFASR